MRRMMIAWGTGLLLGVLALRVWAAPPDVPDSLQAWRGWALDQQEFRDCPIDHARQGHDAGDFVCLWPGVLELIADADGARFVVDWQLHTEAWVPLPGDGEHWPQEVQLDGQVVPVLTRGSIPQVWLKPGRHTLSGHLLWEHRPQSLPVPTNIGIVRLTVDGQAIVPPQHELGRLILGRATSEAPEADALSLQVFRRLYDGAPIGLETVIELAASGQAREEVIGPVLPAGFVPTALTVDAGWPARLEADGRLRVQLQPDVATIRIQARARPIPTHSRSRRRTRRGRNRRSGVTNRARPSASAMRAARRKSTPSKPECPKAGDSCRRSRW